MAAGVSDMAALRANLANEEFYHWGLTRDLDALLNIQGEAHMNFRTCMAKERDLTNALMLAETTLRLTRMAIEDHVPETMTTMRQTIDTIFHDQEAITSLLVPSLTLAYQNDRSKQYLVEFGSIPCCKPYNLTDAMIQERLDPSDVFTPPPSGDDDVATRRYRFLLKEGPRMEERIRTLKRHLAAYDHWCDKFQKRQMFRVAGNYARIRLLLDKIKEEIFEALPANDQAIKQNFENLMERAEKTAKEQVDGIKEQRAEEKRRHNQEPFVHMQEPIGAVTWLDHWNAVGKRSSATPLVRKDHVIDYSPEVEVGDGDGDEDDDDDDYQQSEESDEDGDRVEPEEPQQQPPAPLEELPDLGRDDPRRQPPRAPPPPGNPGDAAWGAGSSGVRRAGQRGPPVRPSSSPVVDAAAARFLLRRKAERKKKMEDAIKVIKQHLEDQIAKAKQRIEDSIAQNGQPTRKVVIESGNDAESGALMVDMDRIFGEWGAYLGLSQASPDDQAELGALLGALYTMVSTLFQEFYEAMEQMYPGGEVVGSESTNVMLEGREDPEKLKTHIYFWVADMSNYQVKLGETLEGVERFGDRFVYTALDLGIIMSPVNGLPAVVELSSDDEPPSALQGLPQPGAAGSSQPPSAGAQGFLDAQEQRKRQKREEEKKAQEAAAAKAAAEAAKAAAAEAALAAERAAAAAAQDAAQLAPGAAGLGGGGDGGAAAFQLDEYGAAGSSAPPAAPKKPDKTWVMDDSDDDSKSDKSK